MIYPPTYLFAGGIRTFIKYDLNMEYLHSSYRISHYLVYDIPKTIMIYEVISNAKY